MKTAIACCLGLAFVGAAAFADAPKDQKLYRASGKLCSAEEAKKIPNASSESFNRDTFHPLPLQGFDNYSGCRTKAEWRLVNASLEQRARELRGWSFNSTPSTPASFDHEGTPPS